MAAPRHRPVLGVPSTSSGPTCPAVRRLAWKAHPYESYRADRPHRRRRPRSWRPPRARGVGVFTPPSHPWPGTRHHGQPARRGRCWCSGRQNVWQQAAGTASPFSADAWISSAGCIPALRASCSGLSCCCARGPPSTGLRRSASRPSLSWRSTRAVRAASLQRAASSNSTSSSAAVCVSATAPIPATS